MVLSLIVAMDRCRAIGGSNRLLWHLPKDLKRFKSLTMGHPILMGRKTWESLPNGALPNRRNVVISRSLREAKGAEVHSSVEEALATLNAEDEVFVIGGGEIYRHTIEQADQLYITEVYGEVSGADTFFPEIKAEDWQETERTRIYKDECHAYDIEFVRLVRRKHE